MRIVIQRVKNARLTVNGELISEIGNGLVVYLGVGQGDSEADCDTVVKKISNLRIFEDDNGKMNYSALSRQADVLLVSQFTLYGDISKGNRPNFTAAEAPDKARELYDCITAKLQTSGLNVKTGIFGAEMQIEQCCDGPVTIIYDTRF